MKCQRWFLLICAIYYIGFIAHAFYLRKTVYGDGIYYYSWLRSVVIDRDIDFSDEYTYFNVRQPITPLGKIGNKYAIGPALLWAPVFLFTHQLFNGNGYALPYQLAVGFTSVGLALVGLLLLWQLLSTLFSDRVSILTIMAIAGATNLLFYGSLDVVNSHALSFFASTLFLTLILKNKVRNWFIIGGVLGLIGIIRPQDLLIGLLLIPYIRVGNAVKTLFGFLLLFAPQLIAWRLLYGTFWINPYLSENEGFNLLRPHVLGVLFSPANGLFLWTPVVLLGFIGLVFFRSQGGRTFTSEAFRRALIGIFIAQLIAVSSWSTWWQGASFSGRMFVGSLPIVAFGVAHILQCIQRQKTIIHHHLYILILSACIINTLLIAFFLLQN